MVMLMQYLDDHIVESDKARATLLGLFDAGPICARAATVSPLVESMRAQFDHRPPESGHREYHWKKKSFTSL